ncbi:MAG: putative multidrug export ATP-binding/permease protein, partial [Armatimonadetes bacterium]|nr:putative multidrug export ATP-binding/permease protein [Armatimonadota bacterium]
FGKDYTWQYVAQRLSFRLRNEVYGHLQQLPISFFDHRKTGQLMSSLSHDVTAVNSVLSALQDSINAPVILVGGIIAMFVINWPLALISCISLPPIAFVIVRATGKMRSYTGRLQHNLSLITEHAEETLAGVRVVKSFGNENYETDRFRTISTNVFRAVLRTYRTRLAMGPMVEYLGIVAIVLVLWVGGKQHIQAPTRYPIELLAAFVIVLQQVANAARNFGNISVNLAAAGKAADRVFTLLDVKNDLVDKPEAIRFGRVEGRIELDNVGFAYSHGIPVLAGISVVMEPGEVVALVGPTGSGKTTIAALVPRFYDVSQGAVRVDGVDVRDCELASLRAQIGIVPQDTVLFAGTLRDNIAYGKLGAPEEEIIAAAKMGNAWEFIEKLPQGLDTVIGERGTRLSGGQRQRIAIARAVLRNPRILILDEATSSLDTQSESLVQEALERLMKHRTTLVIAHRLSTIRNADKILVIKDGHVVEGPAPHAELLAQGGIYSNLYRTQFRADDLPERTPFE